MVSVFNLIHHLPEERNRELCRMARAALRPGGCLVVGDSARPEPGEPVSEHGAISSLLFYAWSHSRNFRPSEIRAGCEEAGFDEVEVHRNERSPWRVVVVGAVILLTGATGTVGSALLRRLTAAGEPVRCLVRDPRRLGDQRVRVQIALGDLADPPSFRNALRGVDTVVHLAASIRDQPRGVDRGAERGRDAAAGAGGRARGRAALPVLLGAGREPPLAHALLPGQGAGPGGGRGVAARDDRLLARRSSTRPGDPWLTLLERLLATCPAVPVSGSGRAPFQPIWAEDVADA